MRFLDIRQIARLNPDYAVQVLMQWGCSEEQAEFLIQDLLSQPTGE
jgi:hypothetical protein